MIRLVDAHAHLDRADELPFRRVITTVFCGTDPETAAALLPLAGENLFIGCALHPWHCARHDVAEMLPFIMACPVLGEIGMDNVWTDVPVPRQRDVFETQLQLAASLNKPVVLHTKGMEAEIVRTLEGFPLRKLIHWYSCMEHLDQYIEQDCYFSVGPDYPSNPAVRQVIRRVPLNRLLTETDGVEALGWALGRAATPRDIAPALTGELEAIAAAHGVSFRSAAETVQNNLHEFILGN